jgi:hypothetical protein
MRARLVGGFFVIVAMAASSLAAAEITGRVSDAKGEAVAEAVVFVQSLPEGATPPAPVPAVLDQVNKEFVPHVLPVVIGSEVSFPNHDQIHHHVYSRASPVSRSRCTRSGREARCSSTSSVIKVGCNIHDWMSGVILVVPTPYFAVPGADGSYRIDAVPRGPYSPAAWHEGAKAKPEDTAKTVEVGDGRTEASFTLDVEPRASRVPLHGRRGYE